MPEAENAVRRELVLPHPPEEVWEALTRTPPG